MSETHPMEAASAQTGQTAAAALQILIMAAQAIREDHQRKQPPASGPLPPVAQQSPDQHQRYADMVRATVQPPAVAQAMVTSPQWPQLATELGRLEGAGVNVQQFLSSAAPVIARVDAEVRALATVQAAPARGQDKSLGERIGEIIRKAVDGIAEGWAKLTGKDRPTTAVPTRVGAEVLAVMTARDAIADQRVVAELVNSERWPAIVEQMQGAHAAGHNPAAALAGVPQRIQQAAAAGITLSATEAAQGLLTEQAKAPAAANFATAAASASVSPQAPAVSTTAGAAPAATATASTPATPANNAAAAAATATSTTSTPGATPAQGPAAARTTPNAPAVNVSHGRGR
ncbi:hypothetical protein [Streptomyces sp. NRRL WC-3742]|uniref:hypothetical protein n=1 Tax=Streptomyces sp. NRRL WC-3742 TaxID=1463934 RepID=UPI0004C99791|nr:hypothetical protein [Streptomyces sp. NRRL WC-3742]